MIRSVTSNHDLNPYVDREGRKKDAKMILFGVSLYNKTDQFIGSSGAISDSVLDCRLFARDHLLRERGRNLSAPVTDYVMLSYAPPTDDVIYRVIFREVEVKPALDPIARRMFWLVKNFICDVESMTIDDLTPTAVVL